jgi:hypothetical protein
MENHSNETEQGSSEGRHGPRVLVALCSMETLSDFPTPNRVRLSGGTASEAQAAQPLPRALPALALRPARPARPDRALRGLHGVLASGCIVSVCHRSSTFHYRVRSHRLCVLPLIHATPDSLRYLVPLFMKRRCDRPNPRSAARTHRSSALTACGSRRRC